jgi:hypothetical protein
LTRNNQLASAGFTAIERTNPDIVDTLFRLAELQARVGIGERIGVVIAVPVAIGIVDHQCGTIPGVCDWHIFVIAWQVGIAISTVTRSDVVDSGSRDSIPTTLVGAAYYTGNIIPNIVGTIPS